jgi:excisionase family DNA binding protein
MPKRPPIEPEGALYVKLPANAVEKLHRAAEILGIKKKDLVANLVSKYVDPDTKQGLGTQAVAELLQLDSRVVLDMAEAGNLPGRKLGTEWRFSRTAIIAWLAG